MSDSLILPWARYGEGWSWLECIDWYLQVLIRIDKQQQIMKVLTGIHLRFKQAQPKMCHSPKVEGGVENFQAFIFTLNCHIF